MATVEQLAQALAEVRQQLTEAQRLATEAQRAAVPTTPGGQEDPRVMNKCPIFSGRDTESISNPRWKVRSQGWRSNRSQGKALTIVRRAVKHHGIAAWKRIKTEHQPDAAGRHMAMLMGIMQPGWGSRNAANFLTN